MGSIGFDTSCIPNIADYDICPHLGFVASNSYTLRDLGPYYRPWDELISQLPSLLASKSVRTRVRDLPLLTLDQLTSDPERRRAYLILAVLVQAYVFESPEAPEALVPRWIAEPFLEICQYWGLEPVLSIIGYCFWNWVVKDSVVVHGNDGAVGTVEVRKKLVEGLDGIEMCASFTGTQDEKAFALVPVIIEGEGGCMVGMLLDALKAASHGDMEFVTRTLEFCVERLKAMTAHLQILHEQCGPIVFYDQIRPLIAGSKGMENKGLPEGIIFDLGDGRTLPVKCVGASAAQGSLFQFLDHLFGIEHKSTTLREMRPYMPRKHREFLERVEQLPTLRGYIETHPAEEALQEVFGDCMTLLRAWRTKHIGVVTRYIVMPAKREVGKEEVKGTAGSLPVPFLKEIRDESV